MLFNVTDTELKNTGNLIPAGSYAAFIDTAEVKTTKDGNGQYIEFMWKIIGPTQKNRTLFTRHNFKNANAQAVEIAKEELKAMMVAGGRTNFAVSSPAEMKGLVCQLYIKVGTDKSGKEVNKVTNYSTPKGDVAAAAHQGKSSSSVTSNRVPGL